MCWSCQPVDGHFAEFCFAHYAVDGHRSEISNPRHPRTVCKTCLTQHVAAGLEAGKLSVPCPAEGCGRTLQTGEVRKHTSAESYMKLLERIRDAEQALGSEAAAAAIAVAAAAGLELRSCPRCQVPIEKNNGCNHMRCYRCDHEFQWSGATLLVINNASSSSNNSSTVDAATTE